MIETSALKELKELARPTPKPVSIGMPGRAEFLSYPALVFTEMADGLVISLGDLEIGDNDEPVYSEASMWLAEFPETNDPPDTEPEVQILGVD